LRHLQNIDNMIEVKMPTDEFGYTGRECPNDTCKGYFKIIFGTGLKGVTDCHCPYCGHTADQSQFHTPDQIEYAHSVVTRKVFDAVEKDFKSMEFDIKPKGPFGIGISMKVQSSPPHPLHHYREKDLETHIECPNCTLKYAVYGVFAFCADCGQHNSLQILSDNLRVIEKMLDMALKSTDKIASKLVENALEDCVSSFDGFGRELCKIHAEKSSNSSRAEDMSFQNLGGAKQNLINLFDFTISDGLSDDEWKTAVRCFQKRHLINHKMGVVDNEYIQKTGDTTSIVGRKIIITEEEVRELIDIVEKIAQYTSEQFDQKNR